jgi:hypothetical protein
MMIRRKNRHDHFKIVAASGHETISVFRRYNLGNETELRTLIKPVDTFMDTKIKNAEKKEEDHAI